MLHRTTGTLLLGLTLAACGNHGDDPGAQGFDHDYEILFQRRTFMPEPDVAGFLASEDRHGILQFYERLRTLEPVLALGIEVHGVQHDRGYYVTVPEEVTSTDLDRIGARALFAMQPLDKVSLRLVPRGEDQPDEALDGRVVIHFVETTPRDELMTALGEVGATLLRLDETHGIAVLELPTGAVLTLARERWIWSIDADIALTPDMDVAKERIGANEALAPPWGTAPVGTGLTGEGVTVGVWEISASVDMAVAGVLESHPDLTGRVAFGPGQQVLPSFHATHVAGVIAGNGAASQAEGGDPLQWAGVAPESQIVSWDANDSAQEMVTSLGLFDTTITNHSFGIIIVSEPLCAAAGSYDATGLAYDDTIRGSSITAFVSPGNNGEQVGSLACPIDVWDDGVLVQLDPAVVDAGYGSVSALGVAKNAIAVGGRRKSQPLGTASFSGRGPTRDGRLKPDIVAISGDDDALLTMPSTPEVYDSDLGVSFAVPQATGAAALLLEHYRASDPTFVQDPAVFKAVLANTAADVGAPGPDYASGFGELRVDEASSAADSYTVMQIDHGQTQVFAPALDLSDACGLRVMATWNDPPAMMGATQQLVHDLDLAVFSGDGEVLPWVLTPSNPLGTAVRGVNSVDNVEQVTIDAPAGDEEIRVTGTSVPMGPQEVVVHWYAVPCDAGRGDEAGAEGADGTGIGDGGDDSEPGCACAADPRGRRSALPLLAALVLARRREREALRRCGVAEVLAV